MKNYELDIVNFYDDSEEVVGYGTKGHHDFELVKQAVMDGGHDEYNGIINSLIKDGRMMHTWYKRIPTKGVSIEVKEGVRGSTPHTVWCLQ